MKINKHVPEKIYTHGGARATHIPGAYEALARTVLGCMLWENQHYEGGKDTVQRVYEQVLYVPTEQVVQLAEDARTLYHLRHVPLILLLALAQDHRLKAEHVVRVIQRADEIAEIIAIYWKDGKKPLPAALKRGLALCFSKFNEYQLAKFDYNNAAVSLRDVMFLVHPHPEHGKAALFKRLANRELKTPETWETLLSAGADKGVAFTKLLVENKLGAMALLRNLRNMEQAGVDKDLIEAAIKTADITRVLPFRFYAAAKAAPRFESTLDDALQRKLISMDKLSGKTIIVVDVSGSMHCGLSSKSDMTRMVAAASLAAILRGVCENPVVYATAGDDGRRIHATKVLPARHGFAMIDAVVDSHTYLGGGGIFLTQSMKYIKDKEQTADRIVVITDEQDCAGASDPPSKAEPFGKTNYLINVGAYENGIAYTPKWVHINGFSEAVVNFMILLESFGEALNQN